MKKILLGGSPCTYWSIAQSPDRRETTNSGMGWELFLNYVIAMQKFKPDFFLYENNESISKEIQSEIEKALGVKLLHINSAAVSAQTRHRVYGTNMDVTGFLSDMGLAVRDILDRGYHKENLIHETRFSGVDDRGVFPEDTAYRHDRQRRTGRARL